MNTQTSNTGLTLQDSLNIDAAFRKYMDDIVKKADNLTKSQDLCGRTAAQNLNRVMTQYQSIAATVFWMDYQVNRKIISIELKNSIEAALNDSTIVNKILEHSNTLHLGIQQDIQVRYAIQLIAFVTRYIRIRTNER